MRLRGRTREYGSSERVIVKRITVLRVRKTGKKVKGRRGRRSQVEGNNKRTGRIRKRASLPEIA